jgi:hypothetical protein
MSEAYCSGSGSTIRDESRKAPTLGAASLLSFAAAPTFALMALLTGIQDGAMPGMLCSAAHDASPLTGMAAMYVLMSAFHSAPWLRLIANRGGGAGKEQN